MTAVNMNCATGEIEEYKPDPLPIEEARALKWAAVKLLREAHETGGVTVPDVGTFQSDEVSRGYVNGAVQMATIATSESVPFAINWTLADNTIVALDGPGMIAVGLAVGGHVADCHTRAQDLRALIEAAEDHDALDAIDIGAGWP